MQNRQSTNTFYSSKTLSNQRKNENLNTLFQAENTKANIPEYNSQKLNQYNSNNVHATLTKKVKNYGREHPTQNVDWIKYNDQNYQQQRQYYYPVGYSQHYSPYQNQNDNSQLQHYPDHRYRNHNNHYFNTYNNYINKNWNSSIVQNSNTKHLTDLYKLKNEGYKNNSSNSNNVAMTEEEMFRKDLRRQSRLFREEVYFLFFLLITQNLSNHLEA